MYQVRKDTKAAAAFLSASAGIEVERKNESNFERR